MNTMKVAIVTGASKGLGELIAHQLERQGFGLALCARTCADGWQSTLKHTYRVNLRGPPEAERFVDSVIADFGRIDVLINNAGHGGPTGPFEDTSDMELLSCFETNVFGPFTLMRKVVPLMKKQGQGMIINIGSKSAVYANPHLAIYSASKSALVTMTQAVAKQFRDSGTNILCVSVCPSGMSTLLRESIYHDAKEQQSPQRVANLVYEIVTGRFNVRQGDTLIVRKNEIITRELEDLVG